MLRVDYIFDAEKLPMHKDPAYLAELKRTFVALHNKSIKRKKAPVRSRRFLKQSTK